MGNQSQKTGVKSPSEATKKIKNAAPAVQAVLEAEPLALFADPMTLQRAMINPGGLPPTAIPGLQRAVGNQQVQLMLARADPAAGIAAQIQRQAIERYAQEQATPDAAAQLDAAQCQPEADGGVELSDPVSDEINQGIRRGGSQLPKGVQATMKRSLGMANPEEIQVHTDGQADTLSKALGARAFTTGSHIFFRQGEYDPGSSKGQTLLYHESVHTVQQGGVKGNAPQTKMVVNPPDDRYEQEAEAVAEQAVLAPEPARPQFVEPSTKPKTKPYVSPKDDEESDEEYEPQAEAIVEPAMQAPANTGPQFAGVNLEILEPGSRLAVPGPYLQMAEETGSKEEKEEKKQKAREEEERETKEEGKEEKKEREKEAKEKGKEREEESKEETKEKEKSSKEEAKAAGEQEGKPKEPPPPPKIPKAAEFTPPPPKADPSVVDGIDGDTAAEVKFDPDTFEFEEPEPEPLLPTWDQLAEGTVQLSMEEVQEEYRMRLGLAESDPADLEEIGTDGAVDVEPGVTPEPPKSGAELVGQAFAEGALAGFTEGAKSWATDTALELATSKIKYADGMINLAKMAYDPKGWVQDNVFAVGDSFMAVGSAFMDIGSEKTPFGVVAATLELAIKVIDFINSIIGLIQQILQILIWIFHVLGKLAHFLFPFWSTVIVILLVPYLPFLFLAMVCPPIWTFCDTMIAWLDPLNQVLSNVGNVLNAIKFQMQPFAIMFRTLDMLVYQGDPEEMEKKQQKLQANIQGYVQSVTQKTAEGLKDKAGKAISKRRDRRKIANLEAKAGDDPDLQAQLAAKKDEFQEEYGESVDKFRDKTEKRSRAGAVAAAAIETAATPMEVVGASFKQLGGPQAVSAVKKGAKKLTTAEGRAEIATKIKAAPGKLGEKIKAVPSKLKAAPSRLKEKIKAAPGKIKEAAQKKMSAIKEDFEERRRKVLAERAEERKGLPEKVKEKAKKGKRKLEEEAAEAQGEKRERLEAARDEVESKREKALAAAEEARRKPLSMEQEEHIRNQEAALEVAQHTREQAARASADADEAEAQARRHQRQSLEAEGARKGHENEARRLDGEADAANGRAIEYRQKAVVEESNQKRLQKEADEKSAAAQAKRGEADQLKGEADRASDQASAVRSQAEEKQRELKSAQEAANEANQRLEETERKRQEAQERCDKALQEPGGEVSRGKSRALRNLELAERKLSAARAEADAANGRAIKVQSEFDEIDTRRKKAETEAQQKRKAAGKAQGEADDLAAEAERRRVEAQGAEARKLENQNRASALEDVAKGRRAAADKARQDAEEAKRLRDQHESETDKLMGVARNRKEEADLYNEAAKEAEFTARKELYRAIPPQDLPDESLPWYWKKYDYWSKKFDPGVLGGQRHGFGITGTDVFGGYILPKILEYAKDYRHARDKTDEAIAARDAGQYQNAFDVIRDLQAKGLGAEYWLAKVKEFEGTKLGLSYFEKQKKIKDYQALADDIRSFFIYDPGKPPPAVGQRLKLQLNTLTPGLPANAERAGGDDTAFVVEMTGEDDEGKPLTLLEDEITDFPVGTGKFEKDYYSLLGAAHGETIGLKVWPQPVKFRPTGDERERTYTPKYRQVDRYDEEYLTRYEVWIGYESTLQFTSTPVTAATVNEPYRYDIETDRGREGNAPSISYGGTLPPGLTWNDHHDGTATLQGTLTVADNYDIELQATDDAGFTATQSFTLTVRERLAFTSTPVTTVTKGQDYTYWITAQDVDAGSLDQPVITDETIPSWLHFNYVGLGTAILMGDANDLEIGEHPIELKAQSRGMEVFQRFTLTVRPPLEFTSIPITYAIQGTSYQYDIVAIGDAGAPLEIIATQLPTTPEWLELRDNGDGTATLAQKPVTDPPVGEYDVELQVKQTINSVDFTATQSFTLTVRARPRFTSTTGTTTVYKDEHFRYAIEATDPDTVGSRLAITAPTKPTWLTLADNGDGTATLQGTPTDVHVGTDPWTLQERVELKVEDDYGYTDTQGFDVTVRKPPQITSGPVGAGTEGVPYTYDIIAQDATVGTLTISDVRKPGWLALNPNGNGAATLEGTPADTEVGPNHVMLEVRDENGYTGTQDFIVTVYPAIQPKRVGGEGAGTAVQGKMEVVQRQTEGEAEGEEEEDEGFISDSDIAYQQQLAARATLLEVAPEPPPNMIERVQGAALAYEAADAEEYDLALQQQQIGGLVEHGQGQMVELEGAQKMTALNKQGVDAQIKDAETQMQAQDQMQTTLASQEGQAKQTAEQGAEGQNMMSKIFGQIMSAFGLGSSQGAGDNGAKSQSDKMKSGVKDTSKTTGGAAEATKSGQESTAKSKARTMQVKEGAESARSDLDALDDKLAADKQENQEGLEGLGEAAMMNEEDLTTVRAEKERLRLEHLQAVTEAEMWAEEHRFIREEIFFQLESDLA